MKDTEINKYAEIIRDCLCESSDMQLDRALTIVNDMFYKTNPSYKQSRIDYIDFQFNVFSKFGLERCINDNECEFESSTGLITIKSIHSDVVHTDNGIFYYEDLPVDDIELIIQKIDKQKEFLKEITSRYE